MPMRRRLTAVVLAACTFSFIFGCTNRPTYPKARFKAGLEQLFAEDNLTAFVRVVDHTVAVKLDYPTALAISNSQVEPGAGFDEAMRRTLNPIHRVLLSTDADIHFYVVLVADPKAPGAYLTLVRYVDDIRRANASMLDTPEIYARTILEPNVASESLTIESYVPRDIRLEEFLSWQLARRIQFTLAQQFQASGLAEIGRCVGQFRNGEFAFTLDIAAPSSERPLDDATMQQALKVSTQVISKVLSSYQFDDYTAIRLIHPSTGRNIVLPKASLQIFR